MRFDVLTIFPEMFAGPLTESVLKRARERGLIAVHVHDIRAQATDRHQSTDDYPYGGGAGMVMKPEPIFRTAEAVLADTGGVGPGETRVILMSPQGRLFRQAVARELAGCARLVLICGRYEGVDERVREHLATDEISIGDYVLTGGELPAMVVIDAVARLVPGVLGDAESAVDESHAAGLLEYPHYTRPPTFRGWRVPAVLTSGHHGAIARWRRREALRRTLDRRPDLLHTAELTPEDHTVLAELGWPHAQPPPPKPKRRRSPHPDPLPEGEGGASPRALGAGSGSPLPLGEDQGAGAYPPLSLGEGRGEGVVDRNRQSVAGEG